MIPLQFGNIFNGLVTSPVAEPEYGDDSTTDKGTSFCLRILPALLNCHVSSCR